MTANAAAWLVAEKAHPFEVREAPTWTPAENEILVRNRAVAINPIDGKVQALAFFPMKYPTIIGQDVAGEVVTLGPGVTQFQQGDRVFGQAPGMVSGELRECAFQSYTILKAHMTVVIPEGFSFEQACALPCGISTSSSGLFNAAPYLSLQYPTEPARQHTGQTVLIWGGASSVGSCGIQLAKAAGYEVFTTASLKNFDNVKKLGATQVFDYNQADVVETIVKACDGKELIGALDCIGGSATTACQHILRLVPGAAKVVATTKPQPKDILEGFTVKLIFGPSLKDNAVGPAVYGDFLPKALRSGSFIPAPEPHIVGRGLEAIQEGVDLMNKGVSAKKLVVSL